MEPTKDRITPEQFYSESKWPEMKDKFDKSALKFSHDDLCQFANDYAQQELEAYRDIIKELLPMAEKTFDSIARHEVIYAPNKLYKEEVAEIIDKARKLIDTVTPTIDENS
jgi:hypothetical protein